VRLFRLCSRLLHPPPTVNACCRLNGDCCAGLRVLGRPPICA